MGLARPARSPATFPPAPPPARPAYLMVRALLFRRDDVEPVAEDVNHDQAHKYERLIGVQHCQIRAEAGSGDAIRDHVEHGAILGRLVEEARREAVDLCCSGRGVWQATRVDRRRGGGGWEG